MAKPVSHKILLLFLLGATFIFSPARPLTAGTTKKLVMNLAADASYLNPILYTDTVSGAVAGLVFNGLVKVNEKLEMVPDLAEKWTVSPDGKSWTFYLRKNVIWHDGWPFTAEDVKFTFDKILDPATNTVRAGDFIIGGRPIKFLVISPYVFQAVLPEPFAPFLVSMSMGILPRHLLEKENINHTAFNRHPVGTGPYKFVAWKSADHLRLTAFNDYFLGRPKIDEIIFRIIPNPTARILSLELGEVDEESLPPLYFDRLRKNKNINIFEYPVLAYTYLGFNLKKPLFSDVRVRRALAYAVDRPALIKQILLGHGWPCYAPTVPVSWAYTDDIIKYDFNPEKARTLLAAAGWRPGPDGLLAKGGKKFEFTAYSNQGNAEREKAAVIIQQQFRSIGVKMNIQIMEWAALVKKINAPGDKDFEAVFMGWSLGLDPDDYTIWHSSQYPRGFNFIGYQNLEVDRLLELGRREVNRGARAAVYRRIYKIISDEQPYLFLWTANSIEAVSKKLKNLSAPGPAGLFVNMEQVDLAE